jgi:hypothetical protein
VATRAVRVDQRNGLVLDGLQDVDQHHGLGELRRGRR